MSVYILNGLQVGRRTGENYAILTLKIQSLGEAIKRTEVIITISCAKYGKELQVSEEKQWKSDWVAVITTKFFFKFSLFGR